MALPTNITARVVPTFPSSVTGQTGIDVTKQNGAYLIGLDLDDFGAAQGSILYRSATAYTSLPPGTSGQVLTSGGAAGNPSWTSSSVADGSITTAKLADGAATFAKIQDITTDRLLGRDTAGSGSVEEIGVGGGIEFDGSQALQRSALTGDVTASAGSNATSIADEAVTFAKMQHIATDKLLGRDTAASGDVEEIGLNGGLEFDGSQGLRRSALTGDVTAAAGGNTTTIADEAVTYAKMQHMTTDRLLGRGTAGTGDVEEITLGTNLSLTGTTLNASGGGGDTGQHAFYATRAAAQTPSQNTWTKIQLSTEVLDVSGYFDPTTNYRYTPTVAGYYFFFGGCSANSADGSASGGAVYKNGSGVAYATQYAGAASAPNSSLVTLVHMNGSTDYAELFGYSSNATPSISSSFFGGFLVVAD